MNVSASAVTALLLFATLKILPAADADLPAGLKNQKELAPGTTLEVPDGKYTTKGEIRIENTRGTAEKPVVIRAANRGKAVISGKAGFKLKDCEHVVIEGFVFENDANQQGVLLEDCRHVRVTRNTFRLNEKEKPRWSQHWLYIIGTRSGHNRVDHNLFEKKLNKGAMFFARGDDATLTPTEHDQLDHNHFRDVVYANDSNGHETLRTGGNDLGAIGRSTHTIMEHNLLERCSGEQEIISLKSSDNIVRHNTFIDCIGSICLRLGNRNEIHHNTMLNPGKVSPAGGVKIYGFDQHVHHNHFQDLTGTGHVAPLAVLPGRFDTETTDQIGKMYSDHTSGAPTRAKIEANVWVDCAALVIGREKPDKDYPFSPHDCTFTENLVVRTQTMKPPLMILGPTREFKGQGNVMDITDHDIIPVDKPWNRWFSVHLGLAQNKDGLIVEGGKRGDFPKPVVLRTKDVGVDAP
ncbi:MAG: polysaccharide lyase 6 family protein [Prosthecobacter sp.]